MTIDKATLRRQALLRRAALSAVQRAASGVALASALREWRGARIAAYASIGDEPDTALLLDGHEDVLLPVLLLDGDLDWAAYDGELVDGAHGTREPPGPRLGRDAVADCSLVVVPALGVDRAGTRLGRGGGSYDRALARTTAYVVAALHPGELHDLLPTEVHDQPVDAAVLPDRGLVRLRPHPLEGLL